MLNMRDKEVRLTVDLLPSKENQRHAAEKELPAPPHSVVLSKEKELGHGCFVREPGSEKLVIAVRDWSRLTEAEKANVYNAMLRAGAPGVPLSSKLRKYCESQGIAIPT